MGHIGKGVVLEDLAFLHETALLYGKVTIGSGSSVFPYVVMRAETHHITIGARTNIQDHAMIHVGDFTPTVIGDDCSITTRATLRGCEIGDRTLIGINATIMDGAKIGKNSIVAGHAMVDKGAVFPDNAIIAGVPAKQIGERDNSGTTLLNARIYELISGNYAQGEERISDNQIQQLMAKIAS
ncbi:MAG: gamma carbonic anhydrase family protein [Pseudomonadota bacterium]